jgi:hypothetical protein
VEAIKRLVAHTCEGTCAHLPMLSVALFARVSGSLSSLICLETSLPLGSIPPHGECSATLHYLALREGLLSLTTSLVLVDTTTHTHYRSMQAATVFAVKQ